MNFDQGVINEPNTHGKLSQMCTQGNPLFKCGPLDLVTKFIIDA
jgi:hypothetical protein